MSNWSLMDHLTNYIVSPRRGDPKEPNYWFSECGVEVVNQYGDTEVLGKCRRAVFLRMAIDQYVYDSSQTHLKEIAEEAKALQKPIDRYTQWVFKAGELFEDYIVDIAKESGVWLASQTSLYIKEYRLSGKLDLIVFDPSDNTERIVEIKSVYGHGGNAVLGTPAQQRKGILGEPRDSNLMQIAGYQYFYGNKHNMGPAKLIYGSRDTGRSAEYEIIVDPNTSEITYQGIYPITTQIKSPPYTVKDFVVSGIVYIEDHIREGKLPKRDFELKYSEEHIAKLFDRGLLNKSDTERFTKRQAQIEKNEILKAQGKKTIKLINPVEKGDWQCDRCKFKDFCYNQDGTVRR